jgi:hypothetical protein
LQDVREPFVTALSGIGSYPQDGAAPAGVAGDEWRASPALLGKNTSGLMNLEARQFDGFLPDDGKLGTVQVLDATDDHVILAGTKSEKIGGIGSAFDDDEYTLLDALG